MAVKRLLHQSLQQKKIQRAMVAISDKYEKRICVPCAWQTGIVELGFTALCSTTARRLDAYVTYDDGSTSAHRIEDVAATLANETGYLS